jgi:hypothetical protein
VVCSLPLFHAAVAGHLEVVKLLVEHGADINTPWGNTSDGKPQINALWGALTYGQMEVANYLRSKGAVLPPGNEELEQEVGSVTLEDHIAEHFGKPRPVSQQEMVPGDPPVSVHVIPPASKRQPVTLVTTGMSDKPMTVPKGEEEYRFAELFIQLPSDWPTTPKKLSDPRYGWPLDWLRRIAHYPHDNDTWLGGSATVIANGDPPAPLAEGVPFIAILLLTSDEEEERLLTSDGRVIHFYRLFPLYLEEYQLERKDGVAALIKLFQKHKISMTLDLNRKNVATTKGK